MTDPKSLWMHQDVSGAPLSLDKLRERSSWLEKKIRQRNLLEYIAAAIVVPVFTGYALFLPNPMVKLGSVMIVVGVLYVMWQLHRRASPGKVDPSAAAASAIAFHRAELERQHQALSKIWRWYLGPMLPGLLVFILGPALIHPPHSWFSVWMGLGVCGLVFVGTWWLNWRTARKLSREIERLDALARE
ncbi:MAG: hypothetical protein ABUS48_01955 [Pseudomonadota bacterium]